jgi:hypothetical protein
MRSSTVKVHMKTHTGEADYQEIEIKTPKASQAIEEEKSFVPHSVSMKLDSRSRDLKLIKQESILKTNFERNVPSPTPIPTNNVFRATGILRPQYSMTATITSSRENIFEAPSNRTPLIQNKKYPMNFPSINRLNTKGSCFLNKSIHRDSDRCFKLILPALNHLSRKILERDPLA